MASEHDDVPQLSGAALAALQQFYAEEEARHARLAELQADAAAAPATMEPFGEDWQLSQFWYSDETAERLADEVLAVLPPGGRVLCLSTPTLYVKLREKGCEAATLLEFDRRFAVYPNFCYYDYRAPLDLPDSVLRTAFDVAVVDPPFLSDECQRRSAETVARVCRTDAKIIVCTGAVMAGVVRDVYGARPCAFRPSHRGNLANDFRCFANYEGSLGWEGEEPSHGK